MKILKNVMMYLTSIVALASLAIPLMAPVAVNAQTTSSNFCYTFSQNLGEGRYLSSQDAAALTTALTDAGVWTSGTPITTYNDTVASAVSGFQEKYATEILAPYGLSYGTGFIGASTRAELNSLYGCSTPIQPVQSTQCPAGFTCTPIGQAPVCPTGYTCTPVTTAPTQPLPIIYPTQPTSPTQSSVVINSITPNSATTGTTVTIYGSGFTLGDTVEFDLNGRAMGGIYGPNLQSVSSNQIVFTLSSMIVANLQQGTTYQVKVTPNYGTNTGSNSVSFTLSSQQSPTVTCSAGWTCGPASQNPTAPTLTSISPTTAALGSTITIYGSGFLSMYTTVVFNGNGVSQDASPNSISSNGTQISIIVPSDLNPGNYTISAVNLGNGLRASSANSINLTITSQTSCPAGYTCGQPITTCPAGYTCTPTPGTPAIGNCPAGWTCTTVATISSISPTSGPAGSPITIYGSSFIAGSGVHWTGPSTNEFMIPNSISSDGTTISGYVPSGPMGTYSLTVSNGNTQSNAVSFTIASSTSQ